ncbi:Uma2 family endonuclease [Streptomyces sp. NPDC020965]|uniref:Uma2 family endonuclease n=1 Tax=Streptomyces sp. NPDC020965 TaxID=3365105 RepID=UPI0037BD435A
MTVLDDRIEMAGNSDADLLDMMFDQLKPTPEGFKTEIVKGTYFVSPQRDTHWEIIRRVVRALEDRFGMGVQVKSDVRIDFPGGLNGFAPDVAKLSDDAVKDDSGRWRYADVEFIAEVISESTSVNDYGPKKDAYAAAEVPVYLIIDPYTGQWHLHTDPLDGAYTVTTVRKFGDPIDLTRTPVGLTLTTDDFPRD